MGSCISVRVRRRAETESRRNLALAADASRRQMMSALTNSIAHELGQPLTSMISNAQAGRMMITANRATPDTVCDIESEGVHATQIIDRHRTMLRGHQLDTKPIDLMDAMAETPPARRRVTISTEVRAAEVEVSVRDTGTGLPAQIDGALFTPYVTTKAHGLGIGLTIARTIVDAHEGTIDARNNPAECRMTLEVNVCPSDRAC